MRYITSNGITFCLDCHIKFHQKYGYGIIENNSHNICELCKLKVQVRHHHLIPRCKGGKNIVCVCQTCESFLHNQWSHNELRDTYNSIETILKSEKFQRFLKWRLKHPPSVIFPSSKNKFRDKNKYH